jgi:beta-glucosidase
LRRDRLGLQHGERRLQLLSKPGSTVGIFTWGSAADLVRLGVTEQERDGVPAGNHVLSGDYQIPSGGWGGFSQNLPAGLDWSSFRGIRLAWYASQPTRPASPTAGDDIKVELKDGGPDGEHSEVWAATFKDNWSTDGSRWKIVDLPFSQFTLSGYQPGDAATRNGTLDLTSAWGYAVTMVPGTATPVGWAIDDVQLYGSAVPAPTATVSAPDVTLVDPGETAQVPVTLTTTDGQPLAADVTVEYANGDGTAVAGTHYDAFFGTLTFPAGTASGATQTIDVVTRSTEPVDDARTLTVDLANQQLILPEGQKISFPIDPFAKHCLVNGVDQLGFLANEEPAIEAFETAHPARVQTV